MIIFGPLLTEQCIRDKRKSQMVNDTKAVYLPNNRIAYRAIGKSYVLVNIENNNWLRLNEVASEIWALVDGRNVGDIASKLNENFDISREEALNDVFEFLEDLRHRGYAHIQEKPDLK